MTQTAPAAALLAWYDLNRRDLPWRARPGRTMAPYRVWLSEIMLQQTTVAAVIPYFATFVQRWPTVTALADAPLDEVLTAWAGLGYYARARNLHACAQAVAYRYGGQFPDSEDALLALPGIGAYTAAAIAAIAFGQRAVVVDGNVERVVARVFAEMEPLPTVKPRLRNLAASVTPDTRPGDFAQAMMDLGATICVPRAPRCLICPLASFCQANQAGIAATLPRRRTKPVRPIRRGVVFWVRDSVGRVLLRRRPPAGLLGGMVEFPTTPWVGDDDAISKESPHRYAPLPADWRPLNQVVRHVFTHFALELAIWTASAGPEAQRADGFWVSPADFANHALPSVMRKVASVVQNGVDTN